MQLRCKLELRCSLDVEIEAALGKKSQFQFENFKTPGDGGWGFQAFKNVCTHVLYAYCHCTVQSVQEHHHAAISGTRVPGRWWVCKPILVIGFAWAEPHADQLSKPNPNST